MIQHAYVWPFIDFINHTMDPIISPILDALDDRWTYDVLGGLRVLFSPIFYIEIHWGPFWRQRRGSKRQ